MEIFLMRHGRTEWNVTKRMQGRVDVPLDQVGWAEAQSAAEGLREWSFDRIFSSPLLRARQTAETVAAGRGLPVEVDERLTEIGFGAMEGIVRDGCGTAQTYFHDPEHYVPWPGGESYEELDARCADVMETLFRPLERDCGRILACSHGAFIKGVVRHVDGRPLKDFWIDRPQPNCSCTILRCEDGVFTLIEQGRQFGRQCPAGPLG